MATGTSPPYARMIGNKFDVSAYCQQPLANAFDQLLSIKFALFTIIRPALKIAARSLFIENKTITISNILSYLNIDAPIISPPPNARTQKQKRSFFERLIHFLIIGIPLAIFVGFFSGIFYFLKTISNNLTIIFTNGSRLYSMCRQDMKFYKENPQLLPSRNIVIDSVIHNGLNFYTHQIINKKLRRFSFLAKPLLIFIESIFINRVIYFFDRIDHIRARYNKQSNKYY